MSQVGDDPDLIAKVVPDYPATGKRTLQDNGSWLQHPHARQRRARPHRHRPHRSRRGRDRGRHTLQADVIVYATGFEPPSCCGPMDIRGRDGRVLASGGASGRRRTWASPIPELPEPLLHVRPGHQPGARRQPDLPLRVPDALHHTVPRTADRRRAHGRWSRTSRRRRTGTSAARPRCARWCGRSPSMKHSFSRTPTAKSTRSARGGSSTTGRGRAQPDPDDFVFG